MLICTPSNHLSQGSPTISPSATSPPANALATRSPPPSTTPSLTSPSLLLPSAWVCAPTLPFCGIDLGWRGGYFSMGAIKGGCSGQRMRRGRGRRILTFSGRCGWPIQHLASAFTHLHPTPRNASSFRPFSFQPPQSTSHPLTLISVTPSPRRPLSPVTRTTPSPPSAGADRVASTRKPLLGNTAFTLRMSPRRWHSFTPRQEVLRVACAPTCKPPWTAGLARVDRDQPFTMVTGGCTTSKCGAYVLYACANSCVRFLLWDLPLRDTKMLIHRDRLRWSKTVSDSTNTTTNR